jgi:PAS domain S-box-containing protein
MNDGDRLLDRRRLAAVGQASVALGGIPLSMDAVAGVAAQVSTAPMGVVSLLDGDWDRLLGLHGIGGIFAHTRRIAVADSLCRHVVRSGEPVWINDATSDPRSAGTSVVTYLGIGAFAAVPLLGADDAIVGSVCALDTRPHEWSPREQAALAGVAATTGLVPGVTGVAGELTVNLLDLVPLLDALVEAFIAIDAAGAILAWNAAATSMFGWTREQAVGRPLHGLLFPEREAVRVRAMLAALATLSADPAAPPRRQTMWATTRSGHQIPVDATIRALPGATGPRICASMLDVSARVTAVADADRNEGLLDAVLASLNTGIFACDDEGRAVFANPAFRSMMNLPNGPLPDTVNQLRRQFIGPGGDPLPPDDYPSHRALNGESVRDAQVEMQSPQPLSSSRFFVTNAERILVNGRPQGAVIALHEVTQARRAHRLLECELLVTRALLRADASPQSTQRVVDAITAGLSAAAVRFWAVDPAADLLRLLASSFAEDPQALGDADAPHLKRAEGVAGQAWATQMPAHLPPDATHSAPAESIHPRDLRTVLAVPVYAATDVVGVLALYTDRTYDDEPALTAHLGRVAADLGRYLTPRRPG